MNRSRKNQSFLRLALGILSLSICLHSFTVDAVKPKKTRVGFFVTIPDTVKESLISAGNSLKETSDALNQGAIHIRKASLYGLAGLGAALASICGLCYGIKQTISNAYEQQEERKKEFKKGLILTGLSTLGLLASLAGIHYAYKN